jgi:hypothetical protein
MKLYAGTSGYAYKEWKGSFYPRDLPAKRMLRHYGEHFRTVEINSTFYRPAVQSDNFKIRRQRFVQGPAEESRYAGHQHDRLGRARMSTAAACGSRRH